MRDNSANTDPRQVLLQACVRWALLSLLLLGCLPAGAVQTYWYNSYTGLSNLSPSTQPVGTPFTFVADFSSNAFTSTGCGVDGWCTYYYSPGGYYTWYDNGVPITGLDTSNTWTDTYTCGTDRDGYPVDCSTDRWQSTLIISTLSPGTHVIRVDFTGQCGTIYSNWCFYSSSASVTVTVGSGGTPLTITTTTLPDGVQDQSYSATLAASGGSGPYTWSLTSGALPPGLALNAGAGTITGTPTSTGTSSFTIQVADTNANTASTPLTILVTGPQSAPYISSISPESASIGTPVTISGSNFGATQGSSTVTFNGVVATPTSWSATTIVAPVPYGATTGSVIVTVNGRSSNSASFLSKGGPRLVDWWCRPSSCRDVHYYVYSSEARVETHGVCDNGFQPLAIGQVVAYCTLPVTTEAQGYPEYYSYGFDFVTGTAAAYDAWGDEYYYMYNDDGCDGYSDFYADPPQPC